MIAAVALLAVAGCGSSSAPAGGGTSTPAGGGSSGSKPAYCSDRSSLQSAVKGLTIPTSSSDISGLKSQLATIKSDATSLADAAKADYASETSAIKSSIDTLDSAVNALPQSPSRAQVAAIATDAASVVSSVKSFSDATASKCS